MSKKFWLLISLIPALVSLSASAKVGGESSVGGADDYRILPAFFRQGKEPVKSCYEVISGFGIRDEALEAMIRKSFSEWAAYIHEKKLDVNLPTEDRIRTGIDLQRGCSGKEELKFFFGLENAEIAPYKSAFQHPFGFAALAANGPAHGVIWIAPPRSIATGVEGRSVPVWSSETESVLQALLLHEVGHVFGNGHVDGTVMTSEIGHFLERDTDPSTSSKSLSFYNRIDAQVELVPCLECKASYPAAPRFDLIDHPDSDWEYAFKLVAGREAKGKVSLSFDRFAGSQSSVDYHYPGSGLLTVKDEAGSCSALVEVETETGRRLDSTHLFEGQGGRYFSSAAYSFVGSLKPAQGAARSVAIVYNMDNTQLRILPLGKGLFARPIFVSAVE